MFDNDRFKTIYSKGAITHREIIVDTETGINYLFVSEGPAGGLTVLLDKNGKPMVTSIKE